MHPLNIHNYSSLIYKTLIKIKNYLSKVKLYEGEIPFVARRITKQTKAMFISMTIFSVLLVMLLGYGLISNYKRNH